MDCDLEEIDIFDLDDCIPTSRTFSQDDCLHAICVPHLRSQLQGISRLVRAQYNFQQGLLITKEIMKKCADCASKPDTHERGLVTAVNQLQNQG
jgi:hypothetical protein